MPGQKQHQEDRETYGDRDIDRAYAPITQEPIPSQKVRRRGCQHLYSGEHLVEWRRENVSCTGDGRAHEDDAVR